MIEVGRIRELVRYPVKSMAGIAAESAVLGWYGLDGDRRFAFRRVGDNSGMPWLTASRLPALLLYQPVAGEDAGGPAGADAGAPERRRLGGWPGGVSPPTHVRTPSGAQLALDSPELQAELAARFGGDVELMRLRHGIFDEAPISVISLATIAGIGAEAGGVLDRRRFRANIVLETERSDIFLEDEWVGGTLTFGDDGPAISVTLRDERCVMVNLDPETAKQDPRVMKTVVRLNGNNAGVYATVLRPGTIRVGDRVVYTER